MQQDLRELFKKDSEEQKHEFRKGHETRLLDRLEEELPQKKKPSFYLLKIAASLVFIISLGYFVFDQYTQEDPIKVAVVEKGNEVETSNEISLGDLSPNFKKVENYYVANISGGVYKESTSFQGGVIVDNKKVFRNLTQDKLHNQMVEEQYK